MLVFCLRTNTTPVLDAGGLCWTWRIARPVAQAEYTGRDLSSLINPYPIVAQITNSRYSELQIMGLTSRNYYMLQRCNVALNLHYLVWQRYRCPSVLTPWPRPRTNNLLRLNTAAKGWILGATLGAEHTRITVYLKVSFGWKCSASHRCHSCMYPCSFRVLNINTQRNFLRQGQHVPGRFHADESRAKTVALQGHLKRNVVYKTFELLYLIGIFDK